MCFSSGPALFPPVNREFPSTSTSTSSRRLSANSFDSNNVAVDLGTSNRSTRFVTIVASTTELLRSENIVQLKKCFKTEWDRKLRRLLLSYMVYYLILYVYTNNTRKVVG